MLIRRDVPDAPMLPSLGSFLEWDPIADAEPIDELEPDRDDELAPEQDAPKQQLAPRLLRGGAEVPP